MEKIKVKCDGKSKEAQEEAFKRGYAWCSTGKVVRTGINELYLEFDGDLSYGNSTDNYCFFNSQFDHKEIDINEFINLTTSIEDELFLIF